jgi:glycine dehydrogenase
MKLNAAAEMLPLSMLIEYNSPFAPLDQVQGYTKMLKNEHQLNVLLVLQELHYN